MCSNNGHHPFSLFCINCFYPILLHVYLLSKKSVWSHTETHAKKNLAHILGIDKLPQESLLCKTFTTMYRFFSKKNTWYISFYEQQNERFRLFVSLSLCNEVCWLTNCRSSNSMTSVNRVGQSSRKPCPEKGNKLIYFIWLIWEKNHLILLQLNGLWK
jgi:hypothetical protein